jgi:hypothetical protein
MPGSRTWNPDEIVATGHYASDCRKITINIDRKAASVRWVEELINQSLAACRNTDTKTDQWSIARAQEFGNGGQQVDGEYEQVNHRHERQHDVDVSQDCSRFLRGFTNSPWARLASTCHRRSSPAPMT